MVVLTIKHAQLTWAFLSKNPPNFNKPWTRLIKLTGTAKGKKKALAVSVLIRVMGLVCGSLHDTCMGICISWPLILATEQEEWGKESQFFLDLVKILPFALTFTSGRLTNVITYAWIFRGFCLNCFTVFTYFRESCRVTDLTKKDFS